MNHKVSVSVALGAFLGLLLLQCAAAKTVHVVGESTAWTVPPTQDFYKTWASTKMFGVGDVLAFNFMTNQHDVYEVPKSSYDSCSSSNAISTYATGPANVNISGPGEHYYICTIGQHCLRGQKLAITAVSYSSTPDALSPMPSPMTQGSPPPSSAPRAFAGFFLVLSSVALGIMVL